jgi:nucleoside-diphosphate kinase
VPPFTERTLILVKPDAVARGLIGEIISRMERAGLAIVGLKVLHPALEHTKSHYASTDDRLKELGQSTLAEYSSLGLDPEEDLGTSDPYEIGKLICQWSAEYLAGGPVVACVVQGVHAVKKTRNICGPTMPRDAPLGTIRGDFSSASAVVANIRRSAVRNLIHASDNRNDPTEPESEIAHWFRRDEVVDYEPAAVQVMYR